MASAISWKVRNVAAVTVALVAVVAAAVGAAGPTHSAPSAPTGGAPAVAPVPGYAVVGTWTRAGTCRDVVAALHRYGLDEFAPAATFADRFRPGGGEPVLDDSCEGTIGRQLTNEFTPDGRFSAFNGLGEQVDTAVYRPSGEHQVVLDRYGGVQVNYQSSGATLVFNVTVPTPCTMQRCRLTAQYAVATFLPGEPWIRG